MGRNLALNDVFSTPVPISEIRRHLDSLAPNPKNIKDLAAFNRQVEAIRDLASKDAVAGRKRNDWAEVAIFSSIRLAEMIDAGQNAKPKPWIESWGGSRGNQHKKNVPRSDDLTLALLDVVPTKDYAHRCKKLKAIPEETIQEYIEKTRTTPGLEISKSALIKFSERSDSLVKSKPKRIRKESLGIHHCSVSELEIEAESVDLIFTDPPYDRQSVALYDDLMRLASEVLVPGGSCLCYCGHLLIPDIVGYAQDHGLRFYWVCARLHDKKTLLSRSGIRAGWKPILWFTRGERFDTATIVHDCGLYTQEKELHEWQQSVDEAQRYIEALSRKGHIVLDPFCGSGTVPMAAKQSGRRWIAADIDADAVQVARERVDGCE